MCDLWTIHGLGHDSRPMSPLISTSGTGVQSVGTSFVSSCVQGDPVASVKVLVPHKRPRRHCFMVVDHRIYCLKTKSVKTSDPLGSSSTAGQDKDYSREKDRTSSGG